MVLLLQRLNGRWREPNFIKRGLLLACAGNRQMGVVHWIKATTENTEGMSWGLGLVLQGLRYRHWLCSVPILQPFAANPQIPTPPAPCCHSAIPLRYRARTVGTG